MLYLDIKNQVDFYLNNDTSATGAAFTAARTKQAINFAYRDEVRRAVGEGSRRWFMSTTNLSWAISVVTLQMPPALSQKGLIRITDITSSDPGPEVLFDETGFRGGMFWKDRNTIQWGSQGPSSARTLQVLFFAEPTPLDKDGDEPDLVPEGFHDLIALSAAVWLRTIADSPPQNWVMLQNEMRIDLYKFLSKGKPMDDVPRVYDIEAGREDYINF